MNPQAQPSATPVPIEDIVGPVSFFPYPVWMVVVAILAVLALVGLGIWLVLKLRKAPRQFTPGEKALADLRRLRDEAATADPYPFSITVADVLRVYLRDAHSLSATTQTSREFLETVRSRQYFNSEEGSALEAFLEKADLIKFARMHATSADCAELVDKAAMLVNSRSSEGRAAQ